MRFHVRIKAIEVDESFIDAVLERGARGLNEKALPHLLKVARERSPVGEARNHNPNRANPEPVQLAPIGTFSNEDEVAPNSSEGILRRLHDIQDTKGKRAVTRFVREAFGTKTRDKQARKFFRATSKRYAGRTPTQIQITRGGGLRGTFRDKPGTLRDSHVIIPARREGNKVIGAVAATAAHAIPVHQGFNHRGGWKTKTSGGTFVKGQKWLRSSLANVKDDLVNPSTYQG